MSPVMELVKNVIGSPLFIYLGYVPDQGFFRPTKIGKKSKI